MLLELFPFVILNGFCIARFLYILWSHRWNFIKFCKHIHMYMYMANTTYKKKGLGANTIGVISLCNSEWLLYRPFPVYLRVIDEISPNLANTFQSSRQIHLINT